MPLKLEQLYHHYHEELQNLYPEEERSNLYFMVLESLGIDKLTYRLNSKMELSLEKTHEMKAALSLLTLGKPVQYILGKAFFMDNFYEVNENVLIPRGETEELVQWLTEQVGPKTTILDIGTGSGCIPISIKKKLPFSTVYSIDVSAEALEVAKRNAKHLLTQGTIQFFQCDILSEFPDLQPDVIVSNPPYVTEEDRKEMHSNVLDFEPHLALFSSTPLQFYERISALAQANLKPNGYLFFEINASFGAEVVQLMKNQGFKEVQMRKDLNGKDRMVMGRK